MRQRPCAHDRAAPLAGVVWHDYSNDEEGGDRYLWGPTFQSDATCCCNILPSQMISIFLAWLADSLLFATTVTTPFCPYIFNPQLFSRMMRDIVHRWADICILQINSDQGRSIAIFSLILSVSPRDDFPFAIGRGATGHLAPEGSAGK